MPPGNRSVTDGARNSFSGWLVFTDWGGFSLCICECIFKRLNIESFGRRNDIRTCLALRRIFDHHYVFIAAKIYISRLAQLVERVTSNDEVSRSSRLMGRLFPHTGYPPSTPIVRAQYDFEAHSRRRVISAHLQDSISLQNVPQQLHDMSRAATMPAILICSGEDSNFITLVQVRSSLCPFSSIGSGTSTSSISMRL